MVKSIIAFRAALFLTLLTFASAVGFAQKPELVVQTGHSSSITSVALSTDGKMIASGSWDNTIKLWEVATGRELRTLTGHANWVRSVSFSPDGRTLASGSQDNTIKLWEVPAGRELRTLTGHGGWIHSVAFSADGKTLVSGGGDNTIKLWELATGRELRTQVGHSRLVSSVAFSADGKTLASGSWDKTIKLWDVSTGRELSTFTGHSNSITSVAFSADGQTLATASLDRTIKTWEVSTGREVRTLTRHFNAVNSVAFSPDGKTLASGSSDNTIKLWEVATGREVRTLTGHSFFVNSVVFSADGQTLASGSADRTLKLWDVATGCQLRTFMARSNWITSIALSPDGRSVAGGSVDHTIKLWAAGREMRTLTGHSNWVNSVALTPDARTLASGSMDKTMKLWDVATGRELRTLAGHSEVYPVIFNPEGHTLASGSADGLIKLWEVATGSELRTLPGHSNIVFSLDFSRDGKTLASGAWDNTIKLWDVATGRELRTLTGHSRFVNSVAFSPDGQRLASGSYDNTIKVWDVATGHELLLLAKHSGSVNSVAFSADGQTLASGSHDHTIKLWDASTGRELRTLTGHSNWVTSVAFSADGKLLVSGHTGGACKLWRVASGELLASLIGLDSADWAVVAPDGRFDASLKGQRLMHWMVGSELIDLEQLKERYYEPGLLAKIFNGEPLRDVSKFENPKLYPEVKYEPPAKGSALVVNLTNRGGGIGRVQILINDKEFLVDARDDKLKQNPNVSQATLTIDLSRAPGRISGGKNRIRVVAWNVENYISSRGDEVTWVASGAANKEPPEVYAIIGGISRYAGPNLKLYFAAKDAVAIANAIELGAKRLFGADKVHLSLLSTDDDPRAIAPSKDNFAKAFAEARKAKPTDILIVYLAGHGITLQRGTDTYCYLTQEARTTDTSVLSDPEVLKQQTITSEELMEWIKQIPALKQAVMLDTCAAGAAQGRLSLTLSREASGDAIRAIERAKDRTGSHILMGSAADALSYETSQYGQGLLTYALLKGMKGPALNNDEFVDISKLFRYAREEVEQLAKNIGGIQKPIIFAPRDETFDVGQLNIEDKRRIFLATPRPIILRPLFSDEQTDDDTLGLMKALRALLRNETFVAARGTREAALVFVDDEEFPGGIRPTGRYTVAGNQVNLWLRLRQNGIEVANVRVTGAREDIATKVFEAIKVAIGTQ